MVQLFRKRLLNGNRDPKSFVMTSTCMSTEEKDPGYGRTLNSLQFFMIFSLCKNNLRKGNVSTVQTTSEL